MKESVRRLALALVIAMLGGGVLFATPYPNYCAYCYANLNYWACIAAGCW